MMLLLTHCTHVIIEHFWLTFYRSIVELSDDVICKDYLKFLFVEIMNFGNPNIMKKMERKFNVGKDFPVDMN